MIITNHRTGIYILPKKFSKSKNPVFLDPGENTVTGYDVAAARAARPAIDKAFRRFLVIDDGGEEEPRENPFEGETLEAITAVINDEQSVALLESWRGLDPRKTVEKLIGKRIAFLRA